MKNIYIIGMLILLGVAVFFPKQVEALTCSQSGTKYRLCHSCSCDSSDCNEGSASNRCRPDDPGGCTRRATGWNFCGGNQVYSVRYNKDSCTRTYTCADSACYCIGNLGYKNVGACGGSASPLTESCSGGGCEDWSGGCSQVRQRVASCDSGCCTPSWGKWSACSVPAGGWGTRTKTDGCGHTQTENCCNPNKTCANYPPGSVSNHCASNLNNGCSNSLNCSQYCPAEDVPPTGDWCCGPDSYQSVLEVQTSTGIQKIRGTQQ